MDDLVIDAICERLRTKTYIKGSKIILHGGLVDKMVFIIRGNMESVEENIINIPLSEGDVCGEELLTWLLEHSPARKGTGVVSVEIDKGVPIFISIITLLWKEMEYITYNWDNPRISRNEYLS